MIFSLSDKTHDVKIPELENTDVICFFSHPHSVKSDSDLWLEILLSSLKMKRSVLVLDSGFQELPRIDFSQRWQFGEACLWIAPRAHSVILEAYPQKKTSFENLRVFLSKSK